MNNKVIVYNFTNIYNEEKFIEKNKFIDLSNLYGTECILANSDLFKAIKKDDLNAIHFIDSGDYHYLTKLFCDLISFPFILIVMDHHTDMQDDGFNALTCGNWINYVKENNNLKRIIIIGPDSRYNDDKITICKKIDLTKFELPIYISIDKDIMAKNIINTNWDQGEYQEIDILNDLKEMLINNKVIGMDICGECEDNIFKFNDIIEDEKINNDFIKLIEEYNK